MWHTLYSEKPVTTYGQEQVALIYRGGGLAVIEKWFG